MLCRTQLVCAARRAAAAFAAGPVLVGGCALAAALLPALAFWAGGRAGPGIRAAAAADAALARSLALSVCLGAGLGGVVLSLLARGRSALGTQLQAAPLSPFAAFAALTLLPLALATASLALPAVCFLLPVATTATPTAVASLVASLALGACATEAALALGRRALHGFLVAGVVGILVALDPASGLASALRGGSSHVALFLAPAAGAAWCAAAAVRPEPPPSRGSIRFAARGPWTAALARYARTKGLRVQALASVAVSGGGALLLLAAGLPRDVSSLFAAATGVLGATVVPLAAYGVDRRAEWLWRAAPRDRRALAFGFSVAALGGGGLVAGAAMLAALVAAPVSPVRLAPLAALAAVAFGAALVAGAAVPWRERAVDQLASYAAFGAAAGALSFPLARAARLFRAEEGPRAAALAAGALLVSLVASCALAGRRT